MPAAAAMNYYEVLGVSQDAPKDEIRKAYLKLAKKYHPDRTGGDKPAEEKLKEINNAYDTLKNPEKRKQYDAMLSNPFAGGGAESGGFDFNQNAGFGKGQGFESIFEDLFGGRGARATRGRRGPRPGEDLETSISITLRDAAKGAIHSIRLRRKAPCATCHGSGATPGSQPETCPQCQGSGQVSRSGGAAFLVSQVCPKCRGTGQYIPKPCATCQGSGNVAETRTVSVSVPAGADSGMRLRLSGQGNAGESGAPAGDLFVVIEVQPDPFFTRKGVDLECEAPVTFAEATLGGTIRVPTLEGQANLRIPAGTQTGRTFRMRGLGLPGEHGRRQGDQLVRVVIEAPEKISAEQEALIKRLRELDADAVYPKRRAMEDYLRRYGKG